MEKAINAISFVFGRLGKFFVMFKKFIPLSIAGIILIISLIQSAMQAIIAKDITIFLTALGNKLFAIDYTIYVLVSDFIQSGGISLFTFLEILSSIYFFWFFFLRNVAKFIVYFAGSGTPMPSAYLIGALILIAVEFSAVKLINGIWFIPWSGFYLFIVNLPMILSNLSIFNIDVVNKAKDLINKTADPEIIRNTL
jgi:hypothetical protein